MLKKNKMITFLIFLVTFSLVNPSHSLANTAYKTFTEDGYGNYVETQTAYTVSETIFKFGDELFRQASDLKIDQNGLLYVSDTGNGRILVGTRDGELVGIIGEDVLARPNGIFISEDEKLYVADEVEAKVFVFSLEGELLSEFGRPDSILFGSSSTFVPEKVAVDRRDNIYIISRGNSNGIIQINANSGQFIGYFSPNRTVVTPLTMFRRAIFSEEQLARMIDMVPPTAHNLNIDDRGLVYTVTQGVSNEAIKKLNMAGSNIIDMNVFDPFPSSIDIGPLENIFVAGENGFIYEYTSEGNLLFVFGGRDDGRQRVGLFGKISAIVVDERGHLYALDPEKNQIQIFEPTEFTNLVHEALTLYQNGDYEASKEPWQEVIRLNSLFDFANLGLGEAYFKEENYEAALTSFRLAKYKDGYSDAFWELRNVWMRENIINLLYIALGLFILKKIVSRVERKYRIWNSFKSKMDEKYNLKLLKDLVFIKNMIRHPIDSFYSIKYENKTSILSSTIFIFLFFVLYVLEKYYSGFIFRTVEDGEFAIGTDFVMVFGVFLLVITCNYLVCTINDGEGKFQHIYSGFVYSFAPYFIIKPFVIIFSNILTFNEVYLLNFTNFFIYSWVAILIVIMIKEINDYTLKETIKIILLTMFTILIAVLLIFIVYVLVAQMLSFFVSIFNEGVYRIEHR
ncbi:tetratricopeptide (TPR) repeat protein [Evansella vedderi]|uniref:Tetratricopeptide (TPR) repeat protein n=1 Tax=Evansella vedderi TaxID=38282 RepID=A0ABU0A1L6_9BACI|nr:YIP1 family protein [Evansella vedderi]MDQ0257370.1 tetratricopeptide (TPR) repeat protein [Evansella vedderi]